MPRKQSLLFGWTFICLILVGIIVTGISLISQIELNPESAHQDNRKLTLNEPKQNAIFTSASQIAGAYIPNRGQAVVYTLRGETGKVLSAGVITPDEKGTFSRNVLFDSLPLANEKLGLEVIVQEKNGSITDKSTVSIIYQDR